MGTVGTGVGTIAKHVGTVGTVETRREIIDYYSLLQFPRFPQFPRLLQQFPHRFPRFPLYSWNERFHVVVYTANDAFWGAEVLGPHCR